MKIEYSNDAACAFISTVLSYRGYSAQLRNYDGCDGYLTWSQDIIINDINHNESCSLILSYFDYDDESGGPLPPLKLIDLWAPENEDLVLYIY